jgi:hypothetical protein
MSDDRLRLLVVKGQHRGNARDISRPHGRRCASYAGVLTTLAPGSTIDICFPDDGDASATSARLDEYDGVVITGSALNLWKAEPMVIGLFTTAAELSARTADLMALHADPKLARIAWRLGIDADILDPHMRLCEPSPPVTARTTCPTPIHWRALGLRAQPV